MNSDALKKRVEELIAKAPEKRGSLEGCFEIYTGALSVLSSVYGEDSDAVRAIKIPGEVALNEKPTTLYNTFSYSVVHGAIGALENLKQELELGLIGNLRLRLTGEVLADLIKLARTVLSEEGDAAKNVSSVLAAASFEDVIRKLGSVFGASTGGEKLVDVLTALKDKGVITGPQFTTAQGYLTFRNKALHADWAVIDRPTVSSVLAFVEGLLLKHFS